MKNMKKLAALVLALIMVASLGTTVLAADVVNDTTHDYQAYQIFSGTQGDSPDLANVRWGTGVNPVTLIAALKAANPTLYASVPTLAAGYTDAENEASAVAVMNALVADGGGADYHADADEFANIAVNHITSTYIEIASDATTVDLPSGYYLIVDVTDVSGAEDANNPALLQVTKKGNIHIAKKYNVPIVEKDIVHGSTTTDIDSHSIGDTVNFRLTATMANNLEDYDMYRVVFHDAMSEGLTFDASSVVITVDGTPITDGYTVNTTCTCGHANGGDACTFEIVFADILTAPVDGGNAIIQNNDNIVVEYSAVINENAIIDGPNPNSVLLEYSNEPDWELPPPEDEPNPVPPTGITPWDEVVVFTTEVGLTKVDNNGDVLTGAEFTLTGEKTNVVLVSAMRFVDWTSGTKYWELNDGTYTTTDPATPGIDTTTYKDTTKVYMQSVVIDKLETKGSSPVTAKAYVGVDGKLEFTGLGPGTYTLVESVVPGGYNEIDEITLVIGFNASTKQFTYDWSWPGGHTFASTAQIEIINQKGQVLPETGGVGTTMFYVVGGIMVAAAVVLLVSKKRVSD